MSVTIREMRDKTGMTQKAFAQLYDIPISTLRKWEQGEAAPAPYIVKLLARTLPFSYSGYRAIRGKNGEIYYYDRNQGIVSDEKGNKIIVQEDLDGVKEQNLTLYLKDLYESFYEAQEKFNRDCRYDKTEDIIWS